MSEEIQKADKKSKDFIKENILLIALIAFTVIFRLYFFFKVGNQPIWWDEGDYLAISKVWALDMQTPEWWAHFTGMRPLLLPLIWTGMLMMGLGETSLRFITILLPSIGSVWLVYLLGKGVYNKKVGLIAGLMMSVYWVFSFYSYRLLTDIPAVFFGLLSLYFFWVKYEKESKPYGLYLCFLFGVIAFSIRFPYSLVPISCALYLLFTRRLTLFKDKTIWKGVGLGIIFLLPYLIYFATNNFAALKFYFESPVRETTPITLEIPKLLLSLPHSFWLAAFIIGLVSLCTLFLYSDIILKQKVKAFNGDLFILIGFIVHLAFYALILKLATDRWLLMLMPYMFIISGKGLIWVYEYVRKYEKTFALIIIGIIILGGFYQNITHSSALINQKKDTYIEVKNAGLWLKENSDKDAKVITASLVQNQYYSERDSYDFHTNDTIWAECSDKFGMLSTDENCQKITEEKFNEKVQRIDPDYMIVSLFEPVFTPQWAYTYPERHNLTAVFGTADSNGNPILIIYKF